MTATVTASRKAAAIAKVAVKAAPKTFAFKGRNALVRNAALDGVATFSYAEGSARADIVARLKAALGNKPTADEVAGVARQYVIGRTAAKLKDDACMAGKSVAEQIAFAALLITSYAQPLKDGVKAKKLRAGQVGRRNVVQHRAIRASEEAWSQIKAEVVPTLSNAMTQGQRDAAKKAKRSTNANPVRGAGKTDAKTGAGITHSELVKADGPVTAQDARAYLIGMASTMLAFSNKHAGVIPTDMGTAVRAFKTAIDKAEALAKSVDADLPF